MKTQIFKSMGIKLWWMVWLGQKGPHAHRAQPCHEENGDFIKSEGSYRHFMQEELQ